jgi:hypothetical protein
MPKEFKLATQSDRKYASSIRNYLPLAASSRDA